MGNTKEDELYRLAGKLAIYWFYDNGIPMTPKNFRKKQSEISKRTGVPVSELTRIYNFIDEEVRRLAFDGPAPGETNVAMGFLRWVGEKIK